MDWGIHVPLTREMKTTSTHILMVARLTAESVADGDGELPASVLFLRFWTRPCCCGARGLWEDLSSWPLLWAGVRRWLLKPLGVRCQLTGADESAVNTSGTVQSIQACRTSMQVTRLNTDYSTFTAEPAEGERISRVRNITACEQVIQGFQGYVMRN